MIISVKAGKTGVSHIRDLRGVIDREKAAIGVLLTLQEPTEPMKQEAYSAGFYEPANGKRYPKIQILTIDSLLSDKRVEIDMPDRTTERLNKPGFSSPDKKATFKKAKKIVKGLEQKGLL